MKEKRSILFVCTGNICRSPTAEAVFRTLAKKAGLELRIESAGLGDWHVGQPPDDRAQHRGHLRALERMAPPGHGAKIRLFAPERDVPDPYYGGPEGFERVLDLVESQCRSLLAELGSSPEKPIS
jgi:protein-tyrosine phosphatase